MAKKKNNPLTDAPVDKLDLFLRTNYKLMLFSFAVVIGVAIITYGTLNIIEQSRLTKADAIAMAELVGLNDPAAIERYSSMANSLTFAKDYIHLQAAIGYSKIGEREKALSELVLVGGEFAEFAQNLHCDIAPLESVCTTHSKTGIFAPFWYYRGVLSAKDEIERTMLMDEFKSVYPESALLSQLERWGF
ncbi:MAG: hypothetical protein LBP51_01680 [Deferribacteraceae bacterium]|jgi:hypothetical protein|nr:hypothetical protein [Deferribacteraceae bacterium]